MKPLLDFHQNQMLLKQEDLEPQPPVLFVLWKDFQQKPVDFTAGNRYDYLFFLAEQIWLQLFLMWAFLKVDIQ